MPVTVSVHLNFREISGAVFVIMTLATVFYVIGFATTGWSIPGGGQNKGLWETCQCYPHTNSPGWLRAVQAMIIIGLIGILVAFILSSLYMFVHSINKNRNLKALMIVCFLSAMFMFIGFCIYGNKMTDLHWSFAMTVIASILCVVAGVLSVVQMIKSRA